MLFERQRRVGARHRYRYRILNERLIAEARFQPIRILETRSALNAPI